MRRREWDRWSIMALVTCIGLLLGGLPAAVAQTVPTPESVLGHKPGDDFYLASYDESLNYFQKLAAASDLIQLEEVGQTSEGRDWYIAIISSAENLRNVEQYREIARRIAQVDNLDDAEARRLAREGKAIIHIDGGLHSTEVAGHQHTIQLAYNIVSGASEPHIRTILDNLIFVLWFSLNPDGQNMVSEWYHGNVGTPYEVSRMPKLYQKYVGHDNNRDGYMNSVPESLVVTKTTVERWHPMVFYNHHQTAPFPTRIWIPPFAEPISSNVHPLMWRWINVFGTAMASYLDQNNMPGSVHRGRGFDDWYPGFIDGVNNYRNIISFLTETALYRYATPHFYTVNDFPEQYRDLRKQVFYSSPWEGGWWRLRDAVDYMIGASMSVLDTSAKYKEEIIYTRYQAGRDVIERFKKEPPFAYIIPQQQHDPQTAALLVEKLKINGIRISQASETLSAHGREYPAGSWVVMMDQPFALLVKELFEIQDYPDLRETPGGAPDLPYDTAGWTLPIQMGVEVAAVMTPPEPDFRNKIRSIDAITPPPGTLEGSGDNFVFRHGSNVAATAVNRIHKAGGRVSLAKESITIGNDRFPPGSFVANGISRGQMETISTDLSLQARATGRISDSMTAIRAPRIGIYSPWGASIDEGWVRWLLDKYEFPYARLRNGDIQAGRLRESFDVIVIAEMRTNAIMEGSAVGTVPPEYAGGIGETGLGGLRSFVHTGGTLITLGNSSLFAIEKFNLPVSNALQGIRNREFFCSAELFIDFYDFSLH